MIVGLPQLASVRLPSPLMAPSEHSQEFMMPIAFSGKTIYPDLNAALHANGMRRATPAKAEPADAQETVSEPNDQPSQPNQQATEPVKVPSKQGQKLPGLRRNQILHPPGKPPVQLLEANDQERYPCVVCLTNDEAGFHLNRIPELLHSAYVVSAFATALTGILQDKKKRPQGGPDELLKPDQPGMDSYYETLDAVWDANQLTSNADITHFEKNRTRQMALRAKERLDEKRQAREAATEPADQPSAPANQSAAPFEQPDTPEKRSTTLKQWAARWFPGLFS